MSKAYLVKTFLLLFFLAPLTGCMMGPTDQTVITSFNHKFTPFGFTENPGETIKFQTLLPGPRAHWITFAETTTGTLPLSGYGHDWYHWSRSNTKLPSWAWTWHSEAKSTAEIRAVGSDGEALWTFKGNLYDFWDPDGSLYELVTNTGSGKQSATVICLSLN